MGEAGALSQFQGENVISPETYRKNEEPVRTPVWFLEENGTLYVHTSESTGKIKRIRRNPKVRVAPSYFRGKPKTEYVEARAELETDPGTVKKYYSNLQEVRPSRNFDEVRSTFLKKQGQRHHYRHSPVETRLS